MDMHSNILFARNSAFTSVYILLVYAICQFFYISEQGTQAGGFRSFWTAGDQERLPPGHNWRAGMAEFLLLLFRCGLFAVEFVLPP